MIIIIIIILLLFVMGPAVVAWSPNLYILK